MGHTLFRNLVAAEFSGVVYPVNPHWTSVGGVRAYPSVSKLPETPDLAVIMVPAVDVPPMLEELGSKGVPSAIVISAGFREIGGEGAVREESLVRTAKKHGIRLIGPNCFGVINTDPEVRLNATFSEMLPPRGNMAFISQSGALGQGILLYARRQGIGFTKFVSVGNRAGVNECDILSDLATDEATRVILLYLESLADGRRFLREVRDVARRKPVIIIKSGRTALGAEASQSHTGGLAHALSDTLYDAVFDEVGVLRADSIADLFRMARAFSSCGVPTGPRLAILTNSGGPGILAADVAVRGGLTLPRLPEEAQAQVLKVASSNSSARNPVDLTADATPEAYRNALRVLNADPEMDSVLVIGTPTGQTTGKEIARTILEERSGSRPLVTCLFGVNDLSEEVALLEKQGVPNFTFPEEGAQALCDLARYSALRSRTTSEPSQITVERSKVAEQLARYKAEGALALPDHQARELLKSYGIAFPKNRFIRDPGSALDAAKEVGYPLVLKVVSPDILHKSEVGGVELHITSDQELLRAIERMRTGVHESAPKARIEGYSIEPLFEGGLEMILGGRQDPDFGPVILFGMGGVYAEAMKDASFRPAPLSVESTERLIESVRTSALLHGYRGQTPRDSAALKDCLHRVSQMMVDHPSIRELDINPLLVLETGKGVVAVDCRIVLG